MPKTDNHNKIKTSSSVLLNAPSNFPSIKCSLHSC